MKKLLALLLSLITVLGTSACTQFLGVLENSSECGDSSSFVSDSSKIELVPCEEYGHSWREINTKASEDGLSAEIVYQCGVCKEKRTEQKQSVALKTLFPWVNLLSETEIEYVLSKCDLGSIAPDLFSCNRYTISTEEDIADIYQYLQTARVVEKEDPFWTGGGANTLIVHTKDGGRYALSSYFNGFTYEGKYYEYLNALPYLSKEYGYSFLWQALLEFKLYDNGTAIRDAEEFLGKLIFTVCDEEYTADEKYAQYRFLSYLGEIEFLTEDIFRVISEEQTATYRIVNGYVFEDCL